MCRRLIHPSAWKGFLRSSADPRAHIYERTGLRSASLRSIILLHHILSDVLYRSFRSTSLAPLPARAVFEVPEPEVMAYEYESLLYCHPLSSQPVVYCKECFGADIATQTLGGFFVRDGRRGIIHYSGFRVVPMHENFSFPFPKGAPKCVPKGGFLPPGRCKIRCLMTHRAQEHPTPT